LQGCFPEAETRTAMNEVAQLYTAGDIFAEGQPIESAADGDGHINFLCLMIAEDCNLRCSYCFADSGAFGGSRGLMSAETSHAAVDFLIGQSGESRSIGLSFFGGEPLLNASVLEDTAGYAVSRTRKADMDVRFSITTNATLINERVLRFLASLPQMSIILSIDGGPEIHNANRKFKNGRDSYKVVEKNIRKLFDDANIDPGRLSIRGTFNLWEPRLLEAVTELLQFGAPEISVEPAFLKSSPVKITDADIDATKRAYDELARHYVERATSGKPYSFFHFDSLVHRIFQFEPVPRPCGAGMGYLAVSADGTLYPCHRFVGMSDFALGNVFDGLTTPQVRNQFLGLSVDKKPTCNQCWAKYYCGGGCHCHGVEFNDTLFEPYSIECELFRHRLELSAYICSVLSDRQDDESSARTKLGAGRMEYDT